MTRLRKLALAALAAVLGAASLTCGGNTQPDTASAIEMVGGDGQTGAVSSTLANPLVVLVTDQSGNPVSGVSVQWNPQGTGSVSPTTSQTGADGKASVQRTLGDAAGQQITTAIAAGLQGSPVTFAATATDGTTPLLSVKTQPSSSAQSGTAFVVQPVIQLKDGNGNDKAQSGLAVTASLATGTGTLGGTLTRETDGTGAAAFTDLAITGAGGSYTLQFTAPGTVQVVSSAITIGATGASIVITTNPPTSALDHEVFDPSVQPQLLVKDAGGSPAAGALVTASASGNGTLEGQITATSDASGIARFTDLGISGTGTTTLQFSTGATSVTASPVDVSALSASATTGSWGPVVDWPMVPLHIHLLPSGKILGWGKYDSGATGTMGGRPRLWDPAAGSPMTAQMINVDTMLFCSGHAFMPDGKLMVSGGHKRDDAGIDVTNIFDPVSQTFTSAAKMAFGRWYPTVTELADGRMVTMAGRDSAGHVVTTPEIWVGNQWAKLPGAGTFEVPYYPRNFVDPTNGLIFMAGERIQSRWFNPNGQGSWLPGGPRHVNNLNRDYGTAAMYEPGKILYAGGGGNRTWAQSPDFKTNVPTATAEMIDLTAASPHWTGAGSMSVPRRHLNSTILPDGTVLITGGTRGGGFVDINEADATKTAELWDPKNPNQWTTLAASSKMRVYHSVSLLLPDGTVLHGASGNALAGSSIVPDEANHEIFSPPYLFKGARPTISSVPASVSYTQTFAVATPNVGQITDVRWIHIGSVTHAFDAGQRANTLTFTPTATGVNVTAPDRPELAPPGFYMLFLLNRNGVPSVGKMVQIQ